MQVKEVQRKKKTNQDTNQEMQTHQLQTFLQTDQHLQQSSPVPAIKYILKCVRKVIQKEVSLKSFAKQGN